MTEENKKLLFSDLSARVLYNPKIRLSFDIHHIDDLGEETIEHQEENSTLIATIHYDDGFIVLNESHNWFNIEDVKPYLRPMSSMTQEEYEEEVSSLFGWNTEWEHYDWLNAHHFDYRGLIEKGLALEAPEGLYKI